MTVLLKDRDCVPQDGELWTLQLAAVACMSIAVKVEEGALPLNLGHLQVTVFDVPVVMQLP